jgi:hypothetical protein
MLFCLGRLSDFVLFACDVLFFWRILSFLRVGALWLLGSLCTLLGSPPLSHGSVLGGCAFCRWDTFGILSLPLERTTIRILDVGGGLAGIGVGG